MKLIIAIIRENQLDQVREALVDADITRITVSSVSGHGRALSDNEIYRGQKVVPNLTPGVRIEIAVNDDYVQNTCDVLMKATQSNDGEHRGSGKIMIMPLDDVIRLRTGERGPDAI